MNIRPAEENDIPEIIDLLNAAFPAHPRNRKHWEWSHANGRGLAVVAADDGRIVGHYSLGLQRFRLRGREIIAGFGQQAAVHPAHRNLRTIVKLVAEAERIAADTCGFVFAFPNETMAPIKERVLGWKRLMVFPAWTISLGELRANLGGRRRAEAARLHDPETLPTTRDPQCLSPWRDSDWYRWRYWRNPLSHYAVYGDADRGFTVLKTHHDGARTLGHIIELHALSEDASVKLGLVSAAVEHFEFADVAEVVIWNEYAPNREFFEGLGFAPAGFRTSLLAKSLDDSAPIHGEWSFDMGISDVF